MQAEEVKKTNTIPRSMVIVRRVLYTLGILVAFVLCFYAFENWRGNRAWNQYLKETKDSDLWIGSPFEPIPELENFAMHPLIRPLTMFDKQPYGPLRWLDGKGYKQISKTMVCSAADYVIVRPLIGDFVQAQPTSMKGLQVYYRGETNFPNGIIEKKYLDGYCAKQRSRSEYHEHQHKYPKTDHPQSSEQDVLLALSMHEEVLAEMSIALKRTRSDFAQEANSKGRFPIVHHPVLHSIAEVYQVRAIARLHAGQIEPALQDIHNAYRLAALVGQEPILRALGVRIAMTRAAHQAVWEGLRMRAFSDAQLELLQVHLKTAEITTQLNSALQSQILILIPRTLNGDRKPHPWLTYGLPHGWAQKAALNMATYFENIAEAAQENAALNDARLTRQPNDVTKEFDRLVLGRSTRDSQQVEVVGWEKVWPRFWRANVHMDLALVACALERYRLKHGSFPQRLDRLVPEHLNLVTKDRVDGAQIRYVLSAGGSFALYSTGANGRDESGRLPAPKEGPEHKGFTGDWVWTYEPPVSESRN